MMRAILSTLAALTLASVAWQAGRNTERYLCEPTDGGRAALFDELLLTAPGIAGELAITDLEVESAEAAIDRYWTTFRD